MARPTEPIPAAAVQRVLQEARLAARGDTRGTLVLLQAAFLEECIRLSIAEQPSSLQVEAVHEFCLLAAHNLRDVAMQYVRASSNEERREDSFGRLHNAQDQATRFATGLRNRFETTELTQTPVDDEETDRDLCAPLLGE